MTPRTQKMRFSGGVRSSSQVLTSLVSQPVTLGRQVLDLTGVFVSRSEKPPHPPLARSGLPGVSTESSEVRDLTDQRPESSEIRVLRDQSPQRPESSETRILRDQSPQRPESSESRDQSPQRPESSETRVLRDQRLESSETRVLRDQSPQRPEIRVLRD